MPEVAVSRKTAAAPAVAPFGETFPSMWPFGRISGRTPYSMMLEFATEMDRMFRGA